MQRDPGAANIGASRSPAYQAWACAGRRAFGCCRGGPGGVDGADGPLGPRIAVRHVRTRRGATGARFRRLA